MTAAVSRRASWGGDALVEAGAYLWSDEDGVADTWLMASCRPSRSITCISAFHRLLLPVAGSYGSRQASGRSRTV
jgi:hypothetical protein